MWYFTTFIFMTSLALFVGGKIIFNWEKVFTTLYDVGECGKYAAVQTNNIEWGFEVFSEIENTFFVYYGEEDDSQ